jgi:hypothetical protein
MTSPHPSRHSALSWLATRASPRYHLRSWSVGSRARGGPGPTPGLEWRDPFWSSATRRPSRVRVAPHEIHTAKVVMTLMNGKARQEQPM